MIKTRRNAQANAVRDRRRRRDDANRDPGYIYAWWSISPYD